MITVAVAAREEGAHLTAEMTEAVMIEDGITAVVITIAITTAAPKLVE